MTNVINHWFQQWSDLTVASGFVLAIFFAFAASVIVPRTPLILAAGATFGFSAYPFIQIGDTIGCVLAFLLSRYVAAQWFQRQLSGRKFLRSIVDGVAAEGWYIVALMRLGAPIPSTIQNYALGLTTIKVSAYALATLTFSIPQIALLTFIGATGRAALIEDKMSGLGLALLLVAVVTATAIIWLVSRGARRMLRASPDC